MRITAFITLAILAGLAVSNARAADELPVSSDGSDPTTWDPKADGPIAAAANHHVIFENENVRIMSVTVVPGASESYHSHAKCAVLVFDSPAKVTDNDKNGVAPPPVLWGTISWTGKTVPKEIPFIWLQPPEALHSVTNNDTHNVHLTRIEMKKGCAAPPK